MKLATLILCFLAVFANSSNSYAKIACGPDGYTGGDCCDNEYCRDGNCVEFLHVLNGGDVGLEGGLAAKGSSAGQKILIGVETIDGLLLDTAIVGPSHQVSDEIKAR